MSCRLNGVKALESKIDLLFKTKHDSLDWTDTVILDSFISHSPHIIGVATNSRYHNFSLEMRGLPFLGQYTIHTKRVDWIA